MEGRLACRRRQHEGRDLSDRIGAHWNRDRDGGGGSAGRRTGGRDAVAGRGVFAGQGGAIPPQDAAQVSPKWPSGNVELRMANYMLQAQQKWTIAPVPNAGGYPGSPYFKITIAGTDRALAATAEAELVVLPPSPELPNNCGASINWPTGAGASCPSRCRVRKSALALSAGRKQFRDAGQIRSGERKTALAVEGAVAIGSVYEYVTQLPLPVARHLGATAFLHMPAAPTTAAPVSAGTLTPPTHAGNRARLGRLHPALAAAGADRRERTDGQRGAGRREERVLSEPVHSGSPRWRHGDRSAARNSPGTPWTPRTTTSTCFTSPRALNKNTSNVLFWAVTVVNSPREMRDVRLAIGSNAASVWWVNGQEVIGIYGDRQTSSTMVSPSA